MINAKNGYAEIKQIAKTCGVKVTDLLALSPSNDPFYAGTPAGRIAAEWFGEIWERFSFGFGTHLRRIHYRVVSQDPPILKPNGEPYHNTENDWKFLGSASLAARYLGIIPTDALIDRRNPEPMIFHEKTVCEPAVIVDGEYPYIYLPDELDLPRLLTTGFRRSQDYMGEVWCEKSTMNDILLPLAKLLGFNLVTGVGEMSETACRNLVDRVVDAELPTRILYISDFDPAGRSMPKAVARKIEYHLQGLDLDIELQPIVLTPEQCEDYSLPRTPIKESERRAGKFERQFGTGATELDALEALYPGELAKIVRENVERYIDPTLPSRIQASESEWDRSLDSITDGVHGEYASEIELLQARYRSLKDDADALENDCQDLWEQITEALERRKPTIKENDVPTAGTHDPFENPLFDSKRSYLEQMDFYAAWKEGRES